MIRAQRVCNHYVITREIFGLGDVLKEVYLREDALDIPHKLECEEEVDAELGITRGESENLE